MTYNHGYKCPSLSNIFYGKVTKIPIIKQIYNWYSDIKFERECKAYEEDFISEYESQSMKFVWGMISYDDLSSNHANLHSMNDIDLIYLKDENKYILGLETIYSFDKEESKIKFLNNCLAAFTKFMEDNNYKTDTKPFYSEKGCRLR